jgi:hypothetical protein
MLIISATIISPEIPDCDHHYKAENNRKHLENRWITDPQDTWITDTYFLHTNAVEMPRRITFAKILHL